MRLHVADLIEAEPDGFAFFGLREDRRWLRPLRPERFRLLRDDLRSECENKRTTGGAAGVAWRANA